MGRFLTSMNHLPETREWTHSCARRERVGQYPDLKRPKALVLDYLRW